MSSRNEKYGSIWEMALAEKWRQAGGMTGRGEALPGSDLNNRKKMPLYRDDSASCCERKPWNILIEIKINVCGSQHVIITKKKKRESAVICL